MLCRFHRIKAADDLAVRSNQYGNPGRAGRFIIRRAVRDRHALIRVRQQVEWEIKLVFKGFVVTGRIEAAAHYNHFI